LEYFHLVSGADTAIVQGMRAIPPRTALPEMVLWTCIWNTLWGIATYIGAEVIIRYVTVQNLLFIAAVVFLVKIVRQSRETSPSGSDSYTNDQP